MEEARWLAGVHPNQRCSSGSRDVFPRQVKAGQKSALKTDPEIKKLRFTLIHFATSFTNTL